MIPVAQFVAGTHEHQEALLEAFVAIQHSGNRSSHYFALEWARRHRKTTLAVNLLIREACRLPDAKYVYVAPTKVMARNIVWDDPTMLKSYLPAKREMGWKLNEQKMMVKFNNGSIIQFGGSDDPDSLRGIDAIGVVPDEWSQHKPQVWSEIFRPIIAGPLPPHLDKYEAFRWAMFLYTPKGINHASIMFDDACCRAGTGLLPDCGISTRNKARWFTSRLDGEKTDILPASELEDMRNDPQIPKSLYEQEIKCSRITTEEMALITSSLLAKSNEHHANTKVSDMPIRKIVSIDPAFGGDKCPIFGMVNCEVVEMKMILDRHRTNEIVTAAKIVAQQIGTKNFVCDAIGNGLGVCDGLASDEAQYHVEYFNSSEKPTEQTPKKKLAWAQMRFGNKRAEAYFYTAEQLRTFHAGPVRDSELLRQLPVASRYKTTAGKLFIIAKDLIRKELGYSPDAADAFVMGVWGTRSVGADTEADTKMEIYDWMPDTLGAGVS